MLDDRSDSNMVLDALFVTTRLYVRKTSMHLALEKQVLPCASVYFMPMFGMESGQPYQSIAKLWN